jgi:putative FmdB family regulatory protein
VAVYEYHCGQHGVFEAVRPMGSGAVPQPCPVCNVDAVRIMSAPALRTGTRRGWSSAIEHCDKSRYAPDVVSRLPPSGAPSRTLNLTPRLRGLPRP